MSTEQRPRLKLELQQADWLLEGLAGFGLLMLLILPAAYYFDLPDTIPTHFNARGEADDFGSKTTIWIMPLIGVGLYVLLTGLNRAPHIFNYGVRITKENAEYQYRLGTRLLRILKVLVMLLFAYIAWGIIQGALSGRTDLGPEVVWLVVGGILATAAWYLFKSFQKK